ncbi:hypothetical protein BU15DRAFT_62726 [Melanogaster broomeanus]|nr:hypothetical protein BU15DRAFT_62726 [Melanogaster broomeanus]
MCGDIALNFLVTLFLQFPIASKVPAVEVLPPILVFPWAQRLSGMDLFGALWYQLIAMFHLLSEVGMNDRFSVKLMVVVVLALDTVHKFLLCAGIWNRLIQYYGDILNLFVIQSPMLFAPSVTSLVSVIVQSYFAYRVWFHCAVKEWKVSVFEVTSNSMLMNLADAYNGIAAAVDIVIAIAMCTLLAMGRTGFSEKTDRMLLRLIVISLNTGLWTAILALLSMILLMSLPSTEMLYTGVNYPLCSLYCNTLLANLNIRPYLQGGEQAYSFRVAPTSTKRSTAPATSFTARFSITA